METIDVLIKPVVGALIAFLVGAWWKEYQRAESVLFIGALALFIAGTTMGIAELAYREGADAQWEADQKTAVAATKERQQVNLLLAELAGMVREKPNLSMGARIASDVLPVLPSKVKEKLFSGSSIFACYLAAFFLTLLGLFPPPVVEEKRQAAESGDAAGNGGE